ncbi:microtubule-associated protein tau-like isoform X2 [Pollicipes pollicipes]|uniref:microtubule-associated protein tau-like isoform X2 n=1 Tax=Pollicipes pollicipes TaxID=41117 RepID=UPI001884D465|nr:microtubule-associated protein tau-like isoform X2 [Pollicipes pollicipes]
MSVSPGGLQADAIAEEPEECYTDEAEEGYLGLGEGLYEGLGEDGVCEVEEGDEAAAEEVVRSPGTSKIPVWVRPKDADRDSGVDEGKDVDQSVSPQKSRSPTKRVQPATSQEKQKKVPMNKVQVGTAASPNIKNVKSRIGSLANSSYKPGGGNIKIESHKIDVSKASTKIQAKSSYKPGGGTKKIESRKLEWKSESKVGSMGNTNYKPGGGNVKVSNQKLEFKERAAPKVGSRDNMQHKPGGGDVKVESIKIDMSAVGSRIGSLDNVKHKPQGGDKKIFNDTEYIRQISSGSGEGRSRRKSQASSIDDATEPVRG